MLSLHHPTAKSQAGLNRREWLRAGGLGALGLTLPNLLQARESLNLGVPTNDYLFGRAMNVIFLYLAGGPPQHETFDPKPEAPVEIRGPFQPIQSNIPGIQFGELLPRTARLADKLAVVRSMSTNDNTHSSSSYWVLTGYKYVGPNPRTVQPTDWPYFGSLVKRYKTSEVLPPLTSVWIPDMMRLNENVTPGGQTGGFMGHEWDPNLFLGDPSLPGYQVRGLKMSNMSPEILASRRSLLTQINHTFDAPHRGPQVKNYEEYQRQAFELLTTGKASKAFAIQDEPRKVRERYGMNCWGQCVLMARRLVEAGVRLVHVQWPREPGDNAVDNPLWDTHAQNADRLEDVLCPQFDVGFSALIEDLDQRGMLEETLVVAIGEFGRTPKINAKGGRDHWGSVFSFAMAGAGISGGQVYGTSDKTGGHPVEDRVQPGDLTATMFHLLGINPQSLFTDREGRPHRLTEGAPLFKLLGTDPATHRRTKSTGDLARVPPLDPEMTLVQTDFQGIDPIKPLAAGSRPKGWRADPLGDEKLFGVRVIEGNAAMGWHGGVGSTDAEEEMSQAILAQEVRSPFAGTYKLRVRLTGEVSDEKAKEWFATNFACRLQFFQFTERSKNAAHRKTLASVDVHPPFLKTPRKFQEVELTKTFVNPNPGANFSFGLGLGVAVLIEKTSPGKLPRPVDPALLARIQIDRVQLDFIGKERNEKVTK